MALNIPNVGQPGDAFLKGMEGGSNMLQKMMLSKYYGQLHPSGDVANALYVEQIGRTQGYDSPAYINAKAAHDLSLANRNSMIDWRGTQQQLAPFRVTSALGRSIAEGQGRGALDILPRTPGGSPRGAVSQQGQQAPQGVQTPQGGQLGTGAPAMHRGQQWYDAEGNPVYPPGAYDEQDGQQPVGQSDMQQDGQPQTPEGVDPEVADAYERELAKKTSDPDARRRNLFATNIDKTIDFIRPKKLTQYSGLKGAVDRLNDEYKAQKGQAPERFKEFQDSMTAAEILADQVRSFYGTSVQPSIIKRLEKLTNPSSWIKTPEIAEQNFNALVKILKSEGETYKESVRSPVKFKRKEAMQQQSNETEQQSQTVTIRNRKTGASETVSIEEARRRGVPNV